MDTEQNKRLVREHYEAAIHRHDFDEVRKQLSTDFLDHEMPPDTPPGPESAVRLLAMLHSAFPDLRVTLDEMIAEGDLVAVRARWTGTHRGVLPLLPVPVSNRSFSFSGMVFWRMRDGKIVERWATIDRLGLQQQLTAGASGAH